FHWAGIPLGWHSSFHQDDRNLTTIIRISPASCWKIRSIYPVSWIVKNSTPCLLRSCWAGIPLGWHSSFHQDDGDLTNIVHINPASSRKMTLSFIRDLSEHKYSPTTKKPLNNQRLSRIYIKGIARLPTGDLA
ncbi:hypothetical protein AB6E89_06060, partial [Vibrio breoganii]